MTNNRSNEIFDRLRKYIPGGVNSPVRAFKSVSANPIVIKSGKGSMIQDEMEGAVSLSIPLKVEWSYGKNWYEAH